MSLLRQCLVASLAFAVCAAHAFQYPETPRSDVVDDYFGTKVPDPYRWLEDLDSKQTAAWVRAQNAISAPYLAALPEREKFRSRLRELWNYERFGVPRETRSGALLYTRNDGLQNQPMLYIQAPGGTSPRLLIDPNTWSSDGTEAMAHWVVSPDGRHVAYARQTAGSDWVEYRVRDTATGEDLPDRVSGVNFNFDAARINWRAGNDGFFYSRFPRDAGAGADKGYTGIAIWYHRLGTPQADDVLVYQRKDQPRWFAWPEVTDDGRYLLIYLERTEDSEKELYVKDLGDPLQPKLDAPLRRLAGGFDARYSLVGNDGELLLLKTTRGAPRSRIVTLDLSQRKPALRELVPQTRDVMNAAIHAGEELLVEYLHDASSRLQRYTLKGRAIGELSLPGVVTVGDLTGRPGSPSVYAGIASFNQPFMVYRSDLKTGKTLPFRELKLRFDPEDYVTEQVFYASRDGTRVPMFLAYRKGLKPGPTTPTLLYGYGGFGNSLTPAFSVPNLVWMERGGVYAQASLRGGNEYGEDWHRGGMLEKKQNVFDDFIAAAQYLVREGRTSPRHLAILGRSNGGLLVGAVVNQRPDLFAVATQAVGVLDMLRYHRFGIGYAWAGDYGTAEKKAGFRYLHAYSPYHNIRPGTRYPATLVMTADHDDRVSPAHSFKYVAALQAAQASDRPVLIRIETQAGHGGGTPLSKTIEETADRLAFTWQFTTGD